MADENVTEEEKPKGNGGLMSVLPLAVIAAAATFGMVWFASAPPPPVNLEVACKEIKPAEKLSVEELEARGAKYVTLEPITVSLAPNAGAKNLKIGISLSTPLDASELTDIQFLRLRDRFLERLRTVDTNLLIDPKAMPVLKQALLAQAQATLGTDAVYSVLITDFLMK